MMYSAFAVAKVMGHKRTNQKCHVGMRQNGVYNNREGPYYWGGCREDDARSNSSIGDFELGYTTKAA